MDKVLFLMLLFTFLGVVAILWIMRDFCEILRDIRRLLEDIQINAGNASANTEDLLKCYDVLSQEVIHCMFGVPRKEGDSK